jgi:hypothetical protein
VEFKKEIFNFFVECSKSESIQLIKRAGLLKLPIYVVQENQVQPFRCYFQNILSVNKFYLIVDKKKIDLKKQHSFCIEVDHKIYFFKSSLFQDAQGIFIENHIQLHELRRRKDTRFDVPIDWRQSCSIHPGTQKSVKMNARAINISWSGIRCEVDAGVSFFDLEQKVDLVIQIHRRSEISCSGYIKYIRRGRKNGSVLGLEFERSTKLFESKIQNICEDLLRYYTLK